MSRYSARLNDIHLRASPNLRLLFIVPYTPNLIRTRPYNLLHFLAKHGHEITLATLWSQSGDQANLMRWNADGVRVLDVQLTRARSLVNCSQALLRPTPLQSVYCWQPELLKRVQFALDTTQPSFDVIHVEHLRGARYGTHLSIREHQIPIVWDSVDCISYLFEQAARGGRNAFGRLVTRFELPRTRWYEAWLVSQFSRVLVTSDQDRRAFGDLVQAFAPPSPEAASELNRIHLLPNGVDLDYFAPQDIPRTPQTIVLTGKMSYHANVAAALYLVNEVMPQVWERFPDVQVQIVGQRPVGQVLDLARKYPKRVSVTGTVADLRPYLARATLAVAPILYGAGIQNKVLEAMAMGTPVVSTSRAVSALAVQNECEVLVGDDPETLSQQVIRMLRNPGLRERLGANGRRYVERCHDWDQITRQLEEIYQEVIRENKSQVRS